MSSFSYNSNRISVYSGKYPMLSEDKTISVIQMIDRIVDVKYANLDKLVIRLYEENLTLKIVYQYKVLELDEHDTLKGLFDEYIYAYLCLLCQCFGKHPYEIDDFSILIEVYNNDKKIGAKKYAKD